MERDVKVDVESFADDYETGGVLDQTPDTQELDFRRGGFVDWSGVDEAGLFDE